MIEQSKKQFFECWISEYCNHLDQVASHKKAAAKLQGESLTPLAIDLQPKSHAIRVAEPAAKTPFNRFHQ